MTKQFIPFTSGSMSDYLSSITSNIGSRIGQESEDYLLNVNETEYMNFIYQEYSVEPIILHLDKLTVTSEERKIPAERFPHDYYVRNGEAYLKTVVKYHIPFSGNAKLLDYKPSTFILWTTNFLLDTNEICFEIISFNDRDPSVVNSESGQVIQNLSKQINFIKQDVEKYNSELPGTIAGFIHARKESIFNKNKLLESLGVPIRKKENISPTYAVPINTKKTDILLKPESHERGYKPDPTLDNTVYEDILQTVHDLGKVFERLPSTYSSKSEEDLRDHILLYLEPRYHGAASGETFNNKGKTDILIRYENENLFIAECKIWHGKELLLDTVTQLLSYLVWRDSKAAIILFVRNKNLSSVLKSIEETLPGHPNYLGFVNLQNDTWFNYRFHINDDRNRQVKLAVLVFHVPS